MLNNLICERAIELGQVVELGLVRREALTLRSQLSFETGELSLRNESVDTVLRR